MEDVAGAEDAAGVTAEASQGERRAAAEIGGHIEAAAHGDKRAEARAVDRPQAQDRACTDGDRRPVRRGGPVELGAHRGAGETDQRVAIEPKGWALHGTLETGGTVRVSHDA